MEPLPQCKHWITSPTHYPYTFQSFAAAEKEEYRVSTRLTKIITFTLISFTAAEKEECGVATREDGYGLVGTSG